MPARAPRTARTADPYELYEIAVQCPEADLRFIDRVFRRHRGRVPLSLREDFCGTALLSRTWVQSRRDRWACGVDLDRAVLRWAGRAAGTLGDARRRLHLERGDVVRRRARVDVQVAFNFSYWVFHERSRLIAYFRTARASIGRDGLFILDIHGGYEAVKDLRERRRKPGFVYVWEQAFFNPVDHRHRCHIHFEFPDGTALRRAFSYDWRAWSVMEVRDALMDAGFRGTEVYCEGTRAGTREGDGVFRLAARCDNDPSFVAYLVAIP
jgi:hypothetical protein